MPGTATGEAYLTAKIVDDDVTLNIATSHRQGGLTQFMREILKEFKRQDQTQAGLLD